MIVLDKTKYIMLNMSLTNSKKFWPRSAHTDTHYPYPKQDQVFTFLQNMSFENTGGKGEIACIEQYLLFPQCFIPFSSYLKLLSANTFSLERV